MARRGDGRKRGHRLVAAAFAAPLLVIVAALGTRSGLWSYEIGHDLLTMRIGVVVATLGLVAAVVLVIAALRRRASLWLALAALAVSAGTLGGAAWHVYRIETGAPDDISTDRAEIPGFGALDARRGGAGPAEIGGPESCPGAIPAPTQAPPATAAWALQESGFSLQGGVSVGRAAGTHTGFWFGVRHDAVIRIRPGRTDIRVAARDGRPHGGEACRLATAISQRLRTLE